jgi:hypothetical protein
MGNRNAKNEQLIVATGTEMKRRPWLEPLSRDGIPLQIFGNLIKFVKVKRKRFKRKSILFIGVRNH